MTGRRTKMRIAYVSPMPPAGTGIADYSADLLPLLAEETEIEVFTGSESVPEGPAGDPWRTFAYRDLPARHRSPGHDVVVYQMGNNVDFHSRIHDLLLEIPGVVVLHELVLHHMIRERTLARGDWEGYLEELRYSYGETGRAAAHRMRDLGIPVDPWRFPLFERVVDHSIGVIVHNEYSRARVLAGRPHVPVEVVPSPVRPASREPANVDGTRLRRDLGLPARGPLVGSFGLVTSLKRLDTSLRAFQRVRESDPDSRYLIVGPVSPYFDLGSLLEGEAGRGVVTTGHLEMEAFHRAMAAVDVAINLRFPSAGETSATLMRLMAAGTPVIVTDDGPMAELPDDCCVKIPPDGYEEAVLAEMLLALLHREELRRALGDNARRFVRERHSVERTARLYRRHLEGFLRAQRRPLLDVPPLAAVSEDDVPSRWLQEVASACADLGVEETDREVLGTVASTLAELGADP